MPQQQVGRSGLDVERALPRIDVTNVWRGRLIAITGFPFMSAPSAEELDAAESRGRQALALGEKVARSIGDRIRC
jgi:hypothetical protein